MVTQDYWGWHLGAHRKEAWPHRQREFVYINWTGLVLHSAFCGDQATFELEPHQDHYDFRLVTSVGLFSHKRGKLCFMTVSLKTNIIHDTFLYLLLISLSSDLKAN